MKSTFFILLLIFSQGLFSQSLTEVVTIAAVGDIMLGTAYPSKDFLPPNNDCTPLLKEVSAYFKNADIAFGNLEGVLTDTLTNVKTCKNPNVCYAFAMPTKYGACLKNAGFNLLSVANNHVGDFGDRGRKTTLRILKEQKIHHAGLLLAPYDTFTVKGIKIGFTAFSANTQVNDIRNIEKATEIVKTLKKTCQLVIVSFHGGAEGAKHRRVPKRTEQYLGENRGDVHLFAHKMIDAGADLLLGHGPHVTRAVELYKDKFITYSMGNFATYSRVNVNGINGIAPLFVLRITKEGKFVDGKIIPTYQIKGEPVHIDPQHRVTTEIIELSTIDFPQSPLLISTDGNMTRR